MRCPHHRRVRRVLFVQCADRDPSPASDAPHRQYTVVVPSCCVSGLRLCILIRVHTRIHFIFVSHTCICNISSPSVYLIRSILAPSLRGILLLRERPQQPRLNGTVNLCSTAAEYTPSTGERPQVPRLNVPVNPSLHNRCRVYSHRRAVPAAAAQRSIQRPQRA